MKEQVRQWGAKIDRFLSRFVSFWVDWLTGRWRQREQLLRDKVMTLETECDRLRDERNQFQQEVQNGDELWELADAENKKLQNQLNTLQEQSRNDLETLRYENQQLWQEREEIELRNLELEDQLDYLNDFLANSQYHQHLAPTINASNAATDEDTDALDLSTLSLAFVGGHRATRRAVLKDLSDRHNFNPKNCVEIPPFTEVSSNRTKIKSSLSQTQLIVVITGYMGHSLTDIVCDLKSTGSIPGELLMVNCRGKSGVLREILNYMKDHPPDSELKVS